MVEEKKENFIVRVCVKDNHGTVHSLQKRVNLAINWNGKGVGKKGGELIEFEKDGKKYQILLEILFLEKGLFKHKVRGYNFKKFLSDAPFELFDFDARCWEEKKAKQKARNGKQDTTVRSTPMNLFRKKEREVEPTQLCSSGWFIIGIIVVSLITLFGWLLRRMQKTREVSKKTKTLS